MLACKQSRVAKGVIDAKNQPKFGEACDQKSLCCVHMTVTVFNSCADVATETGLVEGFFSDIKSDNFCIFVRCFIFGIIFWFLRKHRSCA